MIHNFILTGYFLIGLGVLSLIKNIIQAKKSEYKENVKELIRIEKSGYAKIYDSNQKSNIYRDNEITGAVSKRLRTISPASKAILEEIEAEKEDFKDNVPLRKTDYENDIEKPLLERKTKKGKEEISIDKRSKANLKKQPAKRNEQRIHSKRTQLLQEIEHVTQDNDVALNDSDRNTANTYKNREEVKEQLEKMKYLNDNSTGVLVESTGVLNEQMTTTLENSSTGILEEGTGVLTTTGILNDDTKTTEVLDSKTGLLQEETGLLQDGTGILNGSSEWKS